MQRLQPDYDPEQLGRNVLAKHMSNRPTDDSRLADARSKLLAMCRRYRKLTKTMKHVLRLAELRFFADSLTSFFETLIPLSESLLAGNPATAGAQSRLNAECNIFTTY